MSLRIVLCAAFLAGHLAATPIATGTGTASISSYSVWPAPSSSTCQETRAASGSTTTVSVGNCTGPDLLSYRPASAEVVTDPLAISIAVLTGRLIEAEDASWIEFPSMFGAFSGAFLFPGSGAGVLSFDVELNIYNGVISNAARGEMLIGGDDIRVFPYGHNLEHVTMPIRFGEPLPYSLYLSSMQRIEVEEWFANAQLRVENMTVAPATHAPEPGMPILLLIGVCWLLIRKRMKWATLIPAEQAATPSPRPAFDALSGAR